VHEGNGLQRRTLQGMVRFYPLPGLRECMGVNALIGMPDFAPGAAGSFAQLVRLCLTHDVICARPERPIAVAALAAQRTALAAVTAEQRAAPVHAHTAGRAIVTALLTGALTKAAAFTPCLDCDRDTVDVPQWRLCPMCTWAGWLCPRTWMNCSTWWRVR
jgi:hypothetical protein